MRDIFKKKNILQSTCKKIKKLICGMCKIKCVYCLGLHFTKVQMLSDFKEVRF